MNWTKQRLLEDAFVGTWELKGDDQDVPGHYGMWIITWDWFSTKELKKSDGFSWKHQISMAPYGGDRNVAMGSPQGSHSRSLSPSD
jgi:hypothetical protein